MAFAHTESKTLELWTLPNDVIVFIASTVYIHLCKCENKSKGKLNGSTPSVSVTSHIYNTADPYTKIFKVGVFSNIARSFLAPWGIIHYLDLSYKVKMLVGLACPLRLANLMMWPVLSEGLYV